MIRSRLSVACEKGNLNEVIRLLNNGAIIDDGYHNPMTRACDKGHLHVVKYLISKGADIHFANGFPLRMACQGNHLELVKYLVEEHNIHIHGFVDEPLLDSCYWGHYEIVKYLIEKGANMHASNEYCLRKASEDGELEMVKFLISKGANIYTMDDFETALYLSCKYGKFEVVKYLIKMGANIYENDNQNIEIACENGHVSIVFYLFNFYDNYSFKIHENNNSFPSFYTLVTTFYNKEKWTNIPEIKDNYLFDPNLSLIIASFVW